MRVHTHLVLALNFVAIVALRGITLITFLVLSGATASKCQHGYQYRRCDGMVSGKGRGGSRG